MKILLGAFAALLIAFGWTTHLYLELKEEAGTWRHSIAEAERLAEECKSGIDDIKAQNEENKKKAADRLAESREAARRAQLRNRELENELEQVNEDITEISDQVVGDCPAISDPVYINDILCAGPLGCTRSDPG